MILTVPHPVPTTWVHPRAKAPRRTWQAVQTPAEVPELPDSAFRDLFVASDGTRYLERDGAIWTPLTGSRDRPVDREEAISTLAGATLHGMGATLLGTPLLANDGHPAGTRGSNEEWHGGWRRAENGVDAHRHRLAAFMASDIALTETGAMVRSHGPMLAHLGNAVLMTSPRYQWTSALGCDIHRTEAYLAHRMRLEGLSIPAGAGLAEATSAAAAIDAGLSRGRDLDLALHWLPGAVLEEALRRSPGGTPQGLAFHPTLAGEVAEVDEIAERARLGAVGKAHEVVGLCDSIMRTLAACRPKLARLRPDEDLPYLIAYVGDLVAKLHPEARPVSEDEDSLSALAPT